eukprot:TRINITY_DN18239_c0_g1_i4.p1 TRINITY_DN18239_c0_g1~~TRINITY_DN18239_c0_g1_i4.p1  ORF type:complete len:932 (+),score=136.54 TRINITY_DN18239_c0_g1_i4:51-2798(+)
MAIAAVGGSAPLAGANGDCAARLAQQGRAPGGAALASNGQMHPVTQLPSAAPPSPSSVPAKGAERASNGVVSTGQPLANSSSLGDLIRLNANCGPCACAEPDDGSGAVVDLSVIQRELERSLDTERLRQAKDRKQQLGQAPGPVAYSVDVNRPVVGPSLRIGKVWHLPPDEVQNFQPATLSLHANGFQIRPQKGRMICIAWSPFSLVQACRLHTDEADHARPHMRLFKISVFHHGITHLFATEGSNSENQRTRWVADVACALRVLTKSLFPPFRLAVLPLKGNLHTATRILAGYMLMCDNHGVMLVYCELHAHQDSASSFVAYEDEDCNDRILSIPLGLNTCVSERVGVDCSCFIINAHHFMTRTCAERALWLRAISNIKVKLRHSTGNPTTTELTHFRHAIMQSTKNMEVADDGFTQKALLPRRTVIPNPSVMGTGGSGMLLKPMPSSAMPGVTPQLSSPMGPNGRPLGLSPKEQAPFGGSVTSLTKANVGHDLASGVFPKLAASTENLAAASGLSLLGPGFMPPVLPTILGEPSSMPSHQEIHRLQSRASVNGDGSHLPPESPRFPSSLADRSPPADGTHNSARLPPSSLPHVAQPSIDFSNGAPRPVSDGRPQPPVGPGAGFSSSSSSNFGYALQGRATTSGSSSNSGSNVGYTLQAPAARVPSAPELQPMAGSQAALVLSARMDPAEPARGPLAQAVFGPTLSRPTIPNVSFTEDMMTGSAWQGQYAAVDSPKPNLPAGSHLTGGQRNALAASTLAPVAASLPEGVDAPCMVPSSQSQRQESEPGPGDSPGAASQPSKLHDLAFASSAQEPPQAAAVEQHLAADRPGADGTCHQEVQSVKLLTKPLPEPSPEPAPQARHKGREARSQQPRPAAAPNESMVRKQPVPGCAHWLLSVCSWCGRDRSAPRYRDV